MTFEKINHEAIGAGNKFYVAGGLDLTNSALLDVVEIYDISTGLESSNRNEGLSLYPNPAINQLHIRGIDKIQGKVSLKTYSVTGQEMTSLNISTGAIDISGLTPGIYFIRIDTDYDHQTIKFVKE
jgi:hypothetical protein